MSELDKRHIIRRVSQVDGSTMYYESEAPGGVARFVFEQRRAPPQSDCAAGQRGWTVVRLVPRRQTVST